VFGSNSEHFVTAPSRGNGLSGRPRAQIDAELKTISDRILTLIGGLSKMSLKPVKHAAEFAEILRIIHAGRARAFEAVNVALIDTYWAVGAHLSRKVSEAGWGRGIVQELATWLAAQVPDLKGFSSSNLWRMKQFYEVYQNDENLAPLVRQLSWTHNLIILGQSKQPEEREFYLRLAVRAKWSKRELQRQIESAAFERTVLSDLKLAPVVRVLPQDATGIFKDSYLLDFLDLPERHKEADLQSALLRNLRKFLMELGDGFAFVGEKIRVQVGNQDFELDLLFYHRDLQCLVAFELKTGRFQPEHMGKLSFYLEALDRDRKRPHENPSIGVLLCRTKDNEVVEYAMSRHLSPALVAQYETQMIPKAVLQQKLHEWSLMLQASDSIEGDES
jgi:predicted nuclease of restriction endonuclease-like (RecB) superfamily